jgi:hypothetical protein
MSALPVPLRNVRIAPPLRRNKECLCQTRTPLAPVKSTTTPTDYSDASRKLPPCLDRRTITLAEAAYCGPVLPDW